MPSALQPTPTSREAVNLLALTRSVGIKVIFDLRSAPEIKREAHAEVGKEDVFRPYGIERRWTPVFAQEDYGPEQTAVRYKNYANRVSDGFVKAYHDILLHGTRAYAAVFRHLAQERPDPCLVHCTAGKDRTGVLTALCLLLAGVDEDVIADEYSLTDQGLARLKPLFIERLKTHPALSGNDEGIANMVSSKKENMVRSIEMIKREFGGAHDYLLNQCEIPQADIERVKKNLMQEKK